MGNGVPFDAKFANAIARLTKGISDSDLRRLLMVMCVFELKRGDVLVEEGKHSGSLYIVQSGALKVTVAKAASQIELPEITAGQWIGEVSLLDPGPASATVKVVRPTVVLEFSHDMLEQYFKSCPAAAAIILEALALDLAERLHRTSDGLIRHDAGRFLQVKSPPVEHHGWFKEMLFNLASNR